MLAFDTDSPYLPSSMSPEMLRAELDALGITRQVDAAAALGVNQSTISDWFRGECRIPPMVRLALKAIPKRTAAITPKTRNGRTRKTKAPKN